MNNFQKIYMYVYIVYIYILVLYIIIYIYISTSYILLKKITRHWLTSYSMTLDLNLTVLYTLLQLYFTSETQLWVIKERRNKTTIRECPHSLS